MADLRFKDPKNTENFRQLLARANVKLPLNFSEVDTGSILDADGRDVITIDVNNERSDSEVMEIASWVIVGINTCGGFLAARPDANDAEVTDHG